jgi:hypothetical protein
MNALSSTLAAFQLKLALRAVVPTGIEKIDRRTYLTARARAESAESAIEFGRRLQRHQIAGLRNRGSCSIPTAPTKSPVESVAFASREPQIGA